MKTDTDIIGRFVSILDIPAITSVITGGVYRLMRPINSKKEDICIVPLHIGDDEDIVQEGIMNINFHCPNLSNNTPNESKLEEVTKLILQTLKAFESTTDYFTFNIVYQITIAESGSSFSNIRLKYFIENS